MPGAARRRADSAFSCPPDAARRIPGAARMAPGRLRCNNSGGIFGIAEIKRYFCKRDRMLADARAGFPAGGAGAFPGGAPGTHGIALANERTNTLKTNNHV